MVKLVKFSILILLSGIITSCDSDFKIEQQRVNELLQYADSDYSCFIQNPSYKSATEAIQSVEILNVCLPEDGIKSKKKQLAYDELQTVVNNKKSEILASINSLIKNVAIPIADIHDKLIDVGSSTIVMKLSKGDLLKFKFDGESAINMTIYNMDSKQAVKHLYNKISFQDSLLIQNSAIYLMEIVNKQKAQYTSQSIRLYRPTIEQFMTPYTVEEIIVPAEKGDFMAFPKNEYKLNNLFEEPRKVTLRGSWKAAWSGHKRTIFALNIPPNTVDVAYQLRIDTSEGASYSDGKFYNNLSQRCSKTEILGVTVREKQEAHSSILREILQKMETPRRAEEAYCSMYVFYNAKDAQYFVSKNGGEVVNYDIDYSLIGTQSCNGRFPVKNQKNVYIGFENDQFSGSVYLWVEAVATSTATNYYKPAYK